LDKPPVRTLRQATLVALASAVLFAIMASLARLVSSHIPGPQIAFLRFATGAVVTLVAVLVARVDLRPHHWGWLVARGVFGGVAVLCYFTGIEKIGVGVATLINYTSPVWSLLFAWLLLHERPHPRIVVALLATLAGVALVATGHGQDVRLRGWEMIAVASAVVSGLAIVSVRATRRPGQDGASEGNWIVFASFTFVGLLVTLPTVLPPFGHWVTPTVWQWLVLVLCGLTSVAAQILMTSALRDMTAAGIGVVLQSTVVLTLAVGFLFFDETLTLRAAIGCVITVCGVLWMMRSSGKG
jgi:drug/metabolite transporter (DMT)-like permease